MPDMMEALEWAAGYAERTGLFAPIRNERGYADGWKPPTPEDKRRIITELAQSVVTKDGVTWTGDQVVAKVVALWEEHARISLDMKAWSVNDNFLIEIKEQFGGR